MVKVCLAVKLLSLRSDWVTTEVWEDSYHSCCSWCVGAVLTGVAVFVELLLCTVFRLISCVCLPFSGGSVTWKRNATILCWRSSTNKAWYYFESSYTGNTWNAWACHCETIGEKKDVICWWYHSWTEITDGLLWLCKDPALCVHCSLFVCDSSG